jgi:RNA polymerase sigma-32 factor
MKSSVKDDKNGARPKSAGQTKTKAAQAVATDEDVVVIDAQGTGVDEDTSTDELDESDDELDTSLADEELAEDDPDDELESGLDVDEFEEEGGDLDSQIGSKSNALARSSGSLASRDPLAAYMREVQSHSLLTPDEEKRLAVLYTETQDVNAASRLVTANLRLVVKLAYEYRRAYRNMMDLIQEGNMGLMQAVKKYDPYRGVKLSSYAAWWIRAYMLRFILANWRMVKLGTTQAQRKLFFNLNKEKARLTAMGIEPSSEEIAKSLDVTVHEVEEMDRRLARSDASLDMPVNESDGRTISRVELLPAPSEQPDMVTESAELGELLREHLTEFRKGLGGKDLIIFDQRLVADEPRTLQDLGDEFGVSRERVRQLEARMTGKLRDYLSSRIGDGFQL